MNEKVFLSKKRYKMIVDVIAVYITNLIHVCQMLFHTQENVTMWFLQELIGDGDVQFIKGALRDLGHSPMTQN
jgi:hypothetical protein